MTCRQVDVRPESGDKEAGEKKIVSNMEHRGMRDGGGMRGNEKDLHLLNEVAIVVSAAVVVMGQEGGC